MSYSVYNSAKLPLPCNSICAFNCQNFQGKWMARQWILGSVVSPPTSRHVPRWKRTWNFRLQAYSWRALHKLGGILNLRIFLRSMNPHIPASLLGTTFVKRYTTAFIPYDISRTSLLNGCSFDNYSISQYRATSMSSASYTFSCTFQIRRSTWLLNLIQVC